MDQLSLHGQKHVDLVSRLTQVIGIVFFTPFEGSTSQMLLILLPDSLGGLPPILLPWGGGGGMGMLVAGKSVSPSMSGKDNPVLVCSQTLL